MTALKAGACGDGMVILMPQMVPNEYSEVDVHTKYNPLH